MEWNAQALEDLHCVNKQGVTVSLGPVQDWGEISQLHLLDNMSSFC